MMNIFYSFTRGFNISITHDVQFVGIINISREKKKKIFENIKKIKYCQEAVLVGKTRWIGGR